MYGQFAARCSSLAARRSSLAPRPGDLTAARQLALRSPSRLSRRSFIFSSWTRSQRSILPEEPVSPLACRGPIENVK